LTLNSTIPALALDAADDVGLFGSITVTRHAKEAIKAVQRADWGTAFNNYRAAVGLSPKTLDFYYGLYNAACHLGQWDQADLALTQLFDQDPSSKAHLQAEYGVVLAKRGRYEEAIPVLKNALKNADADANFFNSKLDTLKTKSMAEPVKVAGSAPLVPYVEPTAPVVPTRETVHSEDVRIDKSKFALSFANAFGYSEFIGICTYEGFEKSKDISFFRPPIAKFHIEQVLKGPPLNRNMPLRYEFHDKIGDSMQVPAGWKFGPDKMPKIGSRWLIFIQNAVPRQGAFDTYHGTYGRQEASEENLNQIYAIIEAHRGQQ
jgi:tetratricopeptide (TPR) repeat protein